MAGSTRTTCCHKAVFGRNCQRGGRQLTGAGGNSHIRPVADSGYFSPKRTSCHLSSDLTFFVRTILPETDPSGAEVIAERLRKKVEASETAHADDDTVVRFPVSIGIASQTSDDDSFDAML